MQRSDLEINRMPGVTPAEEIQMRAVRQTFGHGSTGRHQSLRCDVAADDVMVDFVDLGADEELRIDLFKVECVEYFAQRENRGRVVTDASWR
jgi:hypothetical protein